MPIHWLKESVILFSTLGINSLINVYAGFSNAILLMYGPGGGCKTLNVQLKSKLIWG